MSTAETGRRKSARISALEEEKRNKACNKSSDNITSENQTYVKRATSSGKRGRKRKRLEDVGLSSLQDSEDPKDEDYSIYDDQAAYLSYIQEDPETRILEFILDTLQRRDTYNIFAKPVDPQEVWTYYKIIKEPMDFGAIRAKLLEGNYTSLEQFEYDVNLISTNAMHFNSSTTVFYKEARAIQELAQQLFQSLRGDPEQFQLPFLLTRRGPGRKPQNEGRDLHTRVPRPVGRPSSSRGSYIRRKSQAGSSNANSPGMRNGRNSNLIEMERRQTYRLSDEDASLLTIVYNAAKLLLHVDDGDSGYEESLMQFVKNLGPTAQMLAVSKLARPLTQPLDCQPQVTPPIQTQNSVAPAQPILALPAPEVPGGLLGDNNGRMHRSSLYNLPNSDSNASYFIGDASARGYARTSNCGIHINDGASNRNMNPPGTSQLSMVPNYRDKGKMVVDLNQNMELQGSGDTEARAHDQNQNNKVRLESYIRVVRDFSSPGTSSSGMKFRAVDMLGKPNPLQNQQQLQQAQLSSSTQTSNNGILSWAVNMLANTSSQENQQLQPAQLFSTGSSNQSSLLEIMAGRSTYLKPSSSSSLRSPSAKLSSLSEASTSWYGSGSQLNNNNNAAKSAETGQQLQWSQASTEQDLQESCSFLEMLTEGNYQWEKSTFLSKEHLDEGNYLLGSSKFMRKEQQLGEDNSQVGNSTSMRKEPLFDESNFQWGSSTLFRKEQQLDEGNFQPENGTFWRKEQQLDGGNFLMGNGTFVRKEQQLDEVNFQLGKSTFLRKEQQLDEGNFQLGKSTFLRKEQQLDEGYFQLGKSTCLRKEEQLDEGNSSFMRADQLEANFQLGNSTLLRTEQIDEDNFQMGNSTFISKEQLLDEGNFKLGNSTFMSKGQQLVEGSFQLGKSTFMRTEQQLDEGNHQWWNNAFISKEQQLVDSNYQMGNSTFLRKEQQLGEGNYQYLGKGEQQPVDEGVMPEWYNAISSTNERATTSTQWYRKEPIGLGQSLLSLLLVDAQQPNLALQL